MKIIKIVFCILFLSGSLISKGQVKLEAQLGGSNFLGISLNTAFDIPLLKNNSHLLIPSLGLGILAPGWYEPTSIIHAGLNYSYKNWGLGAEVSGFTDNPFWGNDYYNDFANMIVYPNANYTFKTKSNWYFRVSAGAYFAFSKSYYYEPYKSQMEFDGDIIPGAGFSLGYKFCRH